MSDKKQDHAFQETQGKKKPSGAKLVIPFFIVLAVLTVVSFLIPLRPTQSNMEKRNLAEFPEFSLSALVSGSYFDDISTWFSDTFPGRERWLSLSASIDSLHGYSEISIEGDMPVNESVPQITQMPTVPDEIDVPAQTEQTEALPETTVPAETEWGGVNAGDDAEIELASGAVIQIGDSVFNAVGFSQYYSDYYAQTLSEFADAMAERGVNVVSAPCPTAVGILIEPEYLEKLNCARQDETIDYLHAGMNDHVIKVDTYEALIGHNSEYLFFRTDHHWTALGAYYSYTAICEALGYDPAPLDSFEVWDQGEFEGSLYWRAPHPQKLKLDNVYAYIPQGDIEMVISDGSGYGREAELLQDMTNRELNTKYLTFLSSDNALSEITNNSLPDGPTCVLIKDSFGNCLAPFLTQNYYKVYAIDYRKFGQTGLKWFVDEHGVDDVIFAPYVIATQSADGNGLFRSLCR